MHSLAASCCCYFRIFIVSFMRSARALHTKRINIDLLQFKRNFYDRTELFASADVAAAVVIIAIVVVFACP